MTLLLDIRFSSKFILLIHNNRAVCESLHNNSWTHRLVQSSTDIGSIEWSIKSKILPVLPLQLIKVSITRVTEPATDESVNIQQLSS